MQIKFLPLFLLLFTQTCFSAAKIESWNTSQGSRVYYVRTEGLPMVDIEVVFDAGSARDGNQHGISELTSMMLDTGAGKWNADDIAQRFESIGAIFGAGSSKDRAWLSLRTLTQQDLFAKALATLQTILTQPAFNPQDFEREKSRTLAGLKHREESPGALAAIAYTKAVFGDHPYAHPGSGFIKTVEKITPDDLAGFYKQYYVAANAMVVIVGDVNKLQAEQIAEQIFADLPVGNKPEALPTVAMPVKGKFQHIDFESTQTHVLSGLPGTHRNDEDYFTLYVGNHILGGSGLVSKLFKEVREKRGLAYSASSHFAPYFRKGAFTMGLQTRNDQTSKALKVLTQTLQDFVDQGPTEAELIAAKKNIKGGFAMRIDTNSKLTNYVSMIGFYNKPLNYLDIFQEKVEAVTVASIKDAFKRRINPKLLQTITVGGSEK
jgi:zinc protease